MEWSGGVNKSSEGPPCHAGRSTQHNKEINMRVETEKFKAL